MLIVFGCSSSSTNGSSALLSSSRPPGLYTFYLLTRLTLYEGVSSTKRFEHPLSANPKSYRQFLFPQSLPSTQSAIFCFLLSPPLRIIQSSFLVLSHTTNPFIRTKLTELILFLLERQRRTSFLRSTCHSLYDVRLLPPALPKHTSHFPGVPLELPDYRFLQCSVMFAALYSVAILVFRSTPPNLL